MNWTGKEDTAILEQKLLLEQEHTQTLALRSVMVVLFVLVGLFVLVTWQRRRIDKMSAQRHAVATRLAHFKRVSYVLNKHREVEMTPVETAPLMLDDDEEIKEDELEM